MCPLLPSLTLAEVASVSRAPMRRRTIGLVVALGLGLAVRADEYGEDLNSVTDAVGVL